MSPFSCVREREVAELLHQGYWPDASPADLRAHVETCRICSDLVLVTSALEEERRQAMPLPQLEAPGALWWRAQLRRRNAAIEKVARPILGAQVFAVAVGLVVAVAAVIWQAGNWSAWFTDLPRVLHLAALIPASNGDSSGITWMVAVLATIALFSGIVVYFASERQ
jgi:hypothetical protein